MRLIKCGPIIFMILSFGFNLFAQVPTERIWLVGDIGKNKDDIYYGNIAANPETTQFINIKKTNAKAIAFNSDAKRVWFVDGKGDIWFGAMEALPETIKWQSFKKGDYKDIAVETAANRIWVTDKKKKLFYSNITGDTKNIKFIEVNGEAESVVVGINGQIWRIDGKKNIFYCDAISQDQTKIDWKQVPAYAYKLSIGPSGEIWCVGKDYALYYCNQINPANLAGTTWIRIGQSAKSVFVAPSGTVWFVDKKNSPWFSSSIDSTNPANTQWKMINNVKADDIIIENLSSKQSVSTNVGSFTWDPSARGNGYSYFEGGKWKASTPGNFSVVVKANALNDIQITLSPYGNVDKVEFWDRSTPCYKITFGGWSNTQTLVASGKQWWQSSFDKSTLVKAGKDQYYWITIKDNKELSYGLGQIPGQNASPNVVTFPKESQTVDPVQYIAFGGYGTKVNLKEIYVISTGTATATTTPMTTMTTTIDTTTSDSTNLGSFTWDPSTRANGVSYFEGGKWKASTPGNFSVVVKANALNDVQITLSPYGNVDKIDFWDKSTPCYKITFGGWSNTQTLVASGNPWWQSNFDKATLVSAGQDQYYWVTIKNNSEFSYGFGQTPGQNVKGTLTIPAANQTTSPVQYIAFGGHVSTVYYKEIYIISTVAAQAGTTVTPINITSVVYKGKTEHTSGSKGDYTTIVKNEVGNNTSWTIPNDKYKSFNDLLGDPEYGILKILTIKYTGPDGVEKVASAKENDPIILSIEGQVAPTAAVVKGPESLPPVTPAVTPEPSKDAVVPKNFVYEDGAAKDVACGCDDKGTPTAYAIGLDNKIYSYIQASLASSPWALMSDLDENNKQIPSFRDIAASSTGAIVAIRSDSSDIVSFDAVKNIWKKLAGKPDTMKLHKLCIADDKNIYVIGQDAKEKRSIYKYNSTTPGFEKMPATENVKEFSLAMDGTFAAINDKGEIFIYQGNNKWKALSASGEKYHNVAVQDKNNIFAIKAIKASDDQKRSTLALVKWNPSTSKFEPMLGSTWKWDDENNVYEPVGDENKEAFGFNKISVNAGGMVFLIIGSSIFHNDEIGITITPIAAAPTTTAATTTATTTAPTTTAIPAAVTATPVTGVAAPTVSTTKAVSAVVKGRARGRRGAATTAQTTARAGTKATTARAGTKATTTRAGTRATTAPAGTRTTAARPTTRTARPARRAVTTTTPPVTATTPATPAAVTTPATPTTATTPAATTVTPAVVTAPVATTVMPTAATTPAPVTTATQTTP